MSETKIYSICPQCGSYVDISTTHSNEQHHWSDGSTQKQFFCDDEEHIIKCGFCFSVFWREDTHVVEKTPQDVRIIKNWNIGNFVEKQTFKGLVKQMVSNIQFYRELIAKGFANTFERDLYLNVKIVRTVNDFRRPYSANRKSSGLSILDSGFSLKRLGNIISLEEKYQRYRAVKYHSLQHIKDIIAGHDFLFEAECERETHNFKKAISLLKEFKFSEPSEVDELCYGTQSILYGNENCRAMSEKLMRKCKIKSSRIFEI